MFPHQCNAHDLLYVEAEVECSLLIYIPLNRVFPGIIETLQEMSSLFFTHVLVSMSNEKPWLNKFQSSVNLPQSYRLAKFSFISIVIFTVYETLKYNGQMFVDDLQYVMWSPNIVRMILVSRVGAWGAQWNSVYLSPKVVDRAKSGYRCT